MVKKLTLQVLPNRFSICKMRSNYEHPKWAENGIFYSITRTDEELSVITLENNVKMCADRNDGWRLIKIVEKLDFSQVGILNSITETLAGEKNLMFVISTYNTDYVLVKEEILENAMELLVAQFNIIK